MALIDDRPDIRRTSLPAAAPPANALTVRLWLTARASVLMISCFLGTVLFSLWITLVAVSPLTLFAPLLIPVTALMRAYAGSRRRASGALLGEPIAAPYAPRRPGTMQRIVGILRDPASWRDALWALLHSVVGCVTSAVPVAFFLGGVFYLIYPFLFWVTPRPVFDRPFGDWHTLHSVHQSFAVMPAALVCFAVWYAIVVPMARSGARFDRALLRRSH